MIKCQCSMCKEFFETEQEWIGQQAQCPYCQQIITIQPVGMKQQTYPLPMQNQSSTNYVTETGQNSTASLVLGIIGLIAWLIPLFGFPITIVGLILGIRRKYTTGIVLNVIGLSITLINSVIGAVLGAQGKLF